MSYQIRYEKTAIDDLKKLPKPIRKRIVEKIEWLAENADKIIHKSLQGNLSDFYKLRVGDYRVIYELDQTNMKIFIDHVGHRRDIYKL